MRTLFSFLFVLFVSAAAAEETVRFELHWQPQAQFAGTIIADQKGYFKKHLPNTKVQLISAPTPDSRIGRLLNGEVEFAHAWLPDALLHCGRENARMVCLLQLSQNMPLMLVTRADSGITVPTDLDGKRVQVWRDDMGFMMRAFFRKINVKPILVQQNESMLPFIYGAVPVASALHFNEYHTLLERGLKEEELLTFRLSDFGLSFPGTGIYCSPEFLRKKPEICKGIVKAMNDASKFAVDPANEEEVVNTVIEYVRKHNVVTSLAHQRWMLRSVHLDLRREAESWGQLDRRDFERISALIRESGELTAEQITQLPTYEEFFINLLKK